MDADSRVRNLVTAARLAVNLVSGDACRARLIAAVEDVERSLGVPVASEADVDREARAGTPGRNR